MIKVWVLVLVMNSYGTANNTATVIDNIANASECNRAGNLIVGESRWNHYRCIEIWKAKP